MRAALAPVVGLVGLLGATMVSAQELDAWLASQVPGEMDALGAVTIASETLSAGDGGLVTEGHYHVVTSSSTPTGTTRDDVAKPDKWLELRTKTDILLSHRPANHYYIRYGLSGMVFSAAPPKPEVIILYYPPCDDADVLALGPCGDGTGDTATTTAYTYMVPPAMIETAYRGRRGDAEVIFRLPSDPSGGSAQDFNHPTIPGETESAQISDYPVDTAITLPLPAHLAVMGEPEATYTADMKVFEDLSEAREDNFGADIYAANGEVIKLARAVGVAEVDAMLATAEVSTPEDMGGAFRRFIDSDDPREDPDQTANLASVSVGLANPMAPPIHANDNLKPVTADIITSVNVTVTSDAGNFGFGASFHVGANGCRAGAM
ncbi:MAG: hypothetical protein J4F45_12785, partial [Pseudomonadales bacterium]|nr:hypothetical protein [Pseudomonadales bacterium]